MTYKVVLTHTEEGFSVGCPELPGCWSKGDTEAEAISNIREAIQERLVTQHKPAGRNEVRFVEVPEPVMALKGPRGTGAAKPFDFGPLTIELPSEWKSGKVSDLMRILDERQGR